MLLASNSPREPPRLVALSTGAARTHVCGEVPETGQLSARSAGLHEGESLFPAVPPQWSRWLQGSILAIIQCSCDMGSAIAKDTPCKNSVVRIFFATTVAKDV